MGESLSGPTKTASNATLTIGSEICSAPRSESKADEWFFAAAQSVLGKDAGLHLHYITGYPQSSCYAYVARNAAQRRRPPEHFLRKLFRSEQGQPFHAAFMADCSAVWWREHQRARIVGEQVLELTKRT